MKRTLLMAAITIATSLMLSSATYADSITFTATLTGANENPANASPGTGFASVTINTVLNTMLVNVSFTGLEAGHDGVAYPLLRGTWRQRRRRRSAR